MGITLQELADIAGVSKSTASRCLNDSDLISPKTKARVCALAAEYGFVFNAYARGLSIRKSQTIAIVYPYSFKGFNVSLYYAALHEEFRRLLEAAGYDVLLAFTHNLTTQENNIIRLVRESKVDGFLMLGTELDEETLLFLQQEHTPFVWTHYVPVGAGCSQADIVCSDNRYGGWLAADYLLRTGHKRIATITMCNASAEFILRLEGISGALQENGTPLTEDAIFRYDEGTGCVYDFVCAHFAELRRFDAIIAGNDAIGIQLIQSLQAGGVRVPEDISVIGYDDTILAQYTTPPMTSIHPQREQMAKDACGLLLQRIEHTSKAAPQTLMLRPTIAVRQSTR